MPCFRLLYTTSKTNHDIIETIEWIADSGWTADQARRVFHQRFPGAALLQCREIDPYAISQ